MNNPQKGVIAPLVLAIFAALLIGGGVYIYTHNKQSSQELSANSTQSVSAVASTWLPASTLPSSYSVGYGYTWYSIQNESVSSDIKLDPTAPPQPTATVSPQAIYCMNFLVPNADVATFFAASTGEYAKDSQYVYRCNEIVKDADPNSFTILNENFAKDINHVYYVGKIVSGADSASFEAIPSPALFPGASQSPYGKDKNHVYYLSKEMENADPQTFTLSPVIRDKNWIYQNDKIFGPVSLISEAYAHALPPNCTKEGQWAPKPSLVPSIFSKDETVVGYVGPNAVCIIDKKSQKSEYYEKGWENVVALSEDGSMLYYSDCPSKGSGGSPSDCGTYSFDRATGKEESVK